MVVGSAGAMDKMFKRKFYRSGSCSMLVFDEADTMLDDSFRSVSYRLMSELIKPKDDGPISHGDIQGEALIYNRPNYVGQHLLTCSGSF